MIPASDKASPVNPAAGTVQEGYSECEAAGLGRNRMARKNRIPRTTQTTLSVLTFPCRSRMRRSRFEPNHTRNSVTAEERTIFCVRLMD